MSSVDEQEENRKVQNSLKLIDHAVDEVRNIMPIDQSGPNYEITIRDNGKGFDVSALDTSKGIGWANIQSRIELIGGDIHIFSRLAEGTTIKFTIPQYERAYQAAVS